jgi:hypothetical protein
VAPGSPGKGDAMIRPVSLSLLLLCGAFALSARVDAQTATGVGGSDPAVEATPAPAKKAKAKKPAPKEKTEKAKSDPLTLPSSVAGAGTKRGYGETLPMPRRIDPDDIADPYGGVGGGRGSRVSPMMTPSGRPGIGGRF